VVLDVARPEQDGVVPAQEAEDVQENGVQDPRPEYRPVAELVKAIQEKCVEGPMEEKNKQQHGGLPCPCGVPGGCPGQHEQPQMAEGLE
jgi:hypothetical protein